MSTSDTTATRVKHVIAEICGDIAFDAVKEEQQLQALGLDSLDLVEMSFLLEDEFDIQILLETPEAAVFGQPTSTVQQLIDAVQNLINAKGKN